MAYDSDTRVKEKFKDITRRANLQNLELRIFDESNKDQDHWTDGGLTFGPKNCLFGSNDAGWLIKEPYYVDGKKISNETPIIIAEGTYGTETGNTGSAQYARFSHALGAVVDGFIGVYFIPFKSTYTKGDGSSTNSYVRYNMLYAALNASKKEKGEYLFIDAYNEELLVKLLRGCDKNDKDRISNVIMEIKNAMKTFADEHAQDKKCLYNNERVGKLLMFNVVSISDYNYRTHQKYKAGRFRNAHTIVGDALINMYWHNKPFDLVLARFTHDDCRELDKHKKKEWLLLRTTKNINVITLDDLIFKDKNLEKELYEFLDVLPLLGGKLRAKNVLSKKIYDGFNKKEIGIGWDNVEKNRIR